MGVTVNRCRFCHPGEDSGSDVARAITGSSRTVKGRTSSIRQRNTCKCQSVARIHPFHRSERRAETPPDFGDKL